MNDSEKSNATAMREDTSSQLKWSQNSNQFKSI